MQISHQSAQQIVNEIGSLVRQHINMMDETGHIIASTDEKRIGQFHQGACDIIEKHLKELYISKDAETAGVRCGINLPVEFDGAIVGVIGLTGGYDEVIQYGQIVKKMTEILIGERATMDQERLDLRVRSRFLEEWILGEGLLHASALAERGLALGIDIALPRRVMVCSVQNLEHYTDSLQGQQLIEKVENTVAHRMETEQGNIILRNAARQILLVRGRTTLQMRALARSISETAKRIYRVSLVIGIDGMAADLHAAYLQANRAWRSAYRARDGILCYEETSLELFADDISKEKKSEYLHKIFKNCDTPAIQRWIGILEVYFAAEGSLAAAAEKLYIHKNTLQYKLKQLCELTGYDVRLPSNAPVFYMAILFFHDLENELNY